MFANDPFKRYAGEDVTLELIKRTGLRQPFVVEQAEGLDMQMPDSDITVYDIAQAVGEDRPVEVIDVATQAELPGWTMGQWAAYYHSPDRDRIRNVISLEISGTDFGDRIKRPRIVREMDWIDTMWPAELKPKEYPKVQLYCLMGTKDSYTDFHIDFGGSSVFYHILHGSKVFYFIEPTSKNLKKYQKWSSSPDQSMIFFGDEVKECYAVHLKAGNTMIIPTGWIHAVYTPEDAVVIGGNFLHGYNIATQLQIYDIEEHTNVPAKFRFPFYKRINWYAALKYDDLLKRNPSTLSRYELQGIAALAQWLHKDVVSDQATSEQRKSMRADIPSTIVDPVALINSMMQNIGKALEQALVNVQKSKTNSQKQKAPKLILKVKPEKRKEEEEDEYEDDEIEWPDEEIPQEDEALASDDEEYQQEDDEEQLKKVKMSNKRTKTKRASIKMEQDMNSQSSDDDDGLGTRIKKRRGQVSRAHKPVQSSTVKQRLMERIIKRH
ncbi:JmjC domain-containing histone demethylation protein 1 [Apophysomyces ossiformis]|uniref:[histone H3]-dimethyl-L-lysine(36) demethylase n=1 Tax=Apophysomyces ossiformis TaxID=679940 RepID=A0A8H7BZM5_9FUNG|nr:JmjC domain-containing histone demethylation protein 1 [Apophysomyces ossiformis]